MKRITQILASVLFIITVLTVYLAFDFAISNAASNKTSSIKRSNHHHHHPHDEIKITRKRSITLPLLHPIRKSNGTLKHRDEHDDHQSQNIKSPLRVKSASFQKGKTGVKVNKPQKSAKEQRKRLSASTIRSEHHNKHNV
jgi:hypothetical protein